ncbi:MAG TPA: VCBS repeat-containing protein [Thermoanaerobaculia bacterium]|nr:VCBS repeat-containing protein [Thermoanaerobaculia bacterium]
MDPLFGPDNRRYAKQSRRNLHRTACDRPAQQPQLDRIHQPPSPSPGTDYYRVGEKFNVVRGGVPSGTATVLADDHNTCQPVERLAQRSGKSTPQWRSADAVAGKSVDVRRRASALRAPSAGENRELLAVVRRLFAIKAVPASALDQIKSENVAATDLNGDGHIDFIGSFNVRDTRNTHNLFVIVMRDGDGALRADVIRYDRSLNARDDGGAKNWTLVDVEDFDGDGIDEIIVENHGWEWGSYDILRMKREADWQVVYSGGGSGC